MGLIWSMGVGEQPGWALCSEPGKELGTWLCVCVGRGYQLYSLWF